MYYAVEFYHGIGTVHGEDMLMRFETSDERDEFVNRLNMINEYQHPEGVCKAVTRKEAQRRFNLDHFLQDPYRVVPRHRLFTCNGKTVFEIYPKKRK